MVGSGGCGKTFLAQKISKEQGHTYLAHDAHYDYRQKEEGLTSFLDWLAETVNSCPKKNFVLDGYTLFFDTFFKRLEPLIKHHEIKAKVVFAPLRVIKQRRKQQGKPVLDSEILSTYYSIGKSLDWTKCELIDTSTFETVKNYCQLMQILNPVSRKAVEDFVASLAVKPQGYDKYYQAIELPFGIEVKGYSPTKASWKIVSSLISFKGKSVVDLGCNHGYHLFKAE